MRYSTSKEKLNQMHQQLDRQLQMATSTKRNPPKRDALDYRFVSQNDDNKKSTLSVASNRPVVYDYENRDTDILSKKSQISELQRKLMELQKKMDNISMSSDDSVDAKMQGVVTMSRQKLGLKQKLQSKPNQDTARFLLGHQEKEKAKSKFESAFPSLQDEDEQEEDSEDYFEIQKEIQKKKAAHRSNISNHQANGSRQRNRESRESKGSRQNRQNNRQTLRNNKLEFRPKEVKGKTQNTDRRVSNQIDSVLRPKYANQKSNRSLKNDKQSIGKKSIRDSMVSKQMEEKQAARDLPRNSSKKSIQSNSINKSRNKNLSKDKQDRSFDRFSQKNQQALLHSQEIDLVKDLKKMGNLQKQVMHYKRLAKKYKQQLQDYRIMQIEFKQMKKNFAKSQIIRTQQKKIIETLKSKMSSK